MDFYALYITDVALNGRHFVRRATKWRILAFRRLRYPVSSFSLALRSNLMMIQISETLLYGGNVSFGSRGRVFVEIHSDYGLSVACRPLEWKPSSEATFAVPSSLLHHAYVFTLVRRERYFSSVQIQNILIPEIFAFTFDMDIAIFGNLSR